MKTALKAILFFICSLTVVAPGFAGNVYPFATGVAMEAVLPPNEPQTFINPVLWKVKGTCEVISETPENPLSFKMLKNKGTLNDITFLPGESLYIVAHPGEKFALSAEPRAQVEVVNMGMISIKMRCTA